MSQIDEWLADDIGVRMRVARRVSVIVFSWRATVSVDAEHRRHRGCQQRHAR